MQTANSTRESLQFSQQGKKKSEPSALTPLAKGLSSRVAPHSIDAEQALLASCIIEGGQESMTSCITARIQSESFFKPSHQLIYKALLSLYDEGTPVDEIILAEKLKVDGHLEDIGGHVYINEITDRIATPAHLPHYIERVRNTALLRSLIRTSIDTIERAYADQDDINRFLESVEQKIFKINEGRINNTARPLRESIDAAVNLVSRILKRKGELSGVPTGLIDLDRLTFGLHPQEMIIVAGRPSMGKTSLALNIAEAAVLPKSGPSHPTLVFSLEMSADQLAMRLLCSRARVNMSKLQDGFISSEAQKDLVRMANELKEAPLWIDDSGHLTVLELRAKARRIHAQHPLGLIIIDYLQLIHGMDSRVQREQQIAEISRGIKSMAKELNVPVVVGCQLNRDSERERRQPRLSDLRESGSIEQDADLVILIARKKDFNDEEEQSASVVLRDLIVAKHRNGPVGVVPLAYIKNLTRFESHTNQTTPNPA